ncbi:L,D-transpeptidase [Rhodocyclus tenuis]|uniref:L,D-transpeptidase n=1 Tax=Rhodocyclus tenuis TaxID=1066 RepID=UPI001905E41D|nr:L,D-transpeptidase [Rhodocyclus tenuis]MBK1679005.1 L,D-transpeptidase [Rhodocyclus tenuis]
MSEAAADDARARAATALPASPAVAGPAEKADEVASLFISLAQQTLSVLAADGRTLASYPVSTAANGPGECIDSGCTPRGWHRVRARIGASMPENTVFRGRRPTGEIYTPELAQAFPQRDWILTRILWLSGCEPGRNRLGQVDTMRRYIYIHGAPDSAPMGIPASHGCIRMRNADIVELFERVPPYLPVLID